MSRLAVAMIVALAAAPFALAPAPAAAQEYECSQSMLSSVQNSLPNLGQPVDPAKLSCNGLAQLYFLLTNNSYTAGQVRQRAQQVFRNENLLN